MIAIRDQEVPLPGEKVYIAVNFNKIHLFDRSSEKSLGYPESVKKMNTTLVTPSGFDKNEKGRWINLENK